ncbi:MAG: PCRF domain-containing protein [Candidatus Dojkabacteria bacterium]|nr:PCRF domain-containing protein [Candidatus Dojkabacteria bacterium]
MFSELVEKFERLKSYINDSEIQQKLHIIQSKIYELNEDLFKDRDKLKEIYEEQSKYEELFSLYIKVEKIIVTYQQNIDLMRQNKDFEELVQEENNLLTEELRKTIDKIENLLIPKLDNDDKPCFFEIKPGVGGIEACIFAEDLYKMYVQYLNKHNYQYTIYEIEYNLEGGINYVSFSVDDKSSFSKFRFESGIHRVQRIPITEASGRIHTSTAAVLVIPKLKKNDNIVIKPEDIRIDCFRSSGPGGQSVNTTDSAVRITHLPTNIVVSCQATKSQLQNREMAMEILYSRLMDLEYQKNKQMEQKLRNEIIKGNDRAFKIRTYNFNQSRVTDHRIDKSWFNIQEILNGDLSDILETVNKQIRLDQLKFSN